MHVDVQERHRLTAITYPGFHISLTNCSVSGFFFVHFYVWPIKSKTWILGTQSFLSQPWVFFEKLTWVLSLSDQSFLGSEKLAILFSCHAFLFNPCGNWQHYSQIGVYIKDFWKSEKVKNLSFYEKYLSFFRKPEFFLPEFFFRSAQKKPGVYSTQVILKFFPHLQYVV